MEGMVHCQNANLFYLCYVCSYFDFSIFLGTSFIHLFHLLFLRFYLRQWPFLLLRFNRSFISFYISIPFSFHAKIITLNPCPGRTRKFLEKLFNNSKNVQELSWRWRVHQRFSPESESSNLLALFIQSGKCSMKAKYCKY